jgi:hypothetical protein
LCLVDIDYSVSPIFSHFRPLVRANDSIDIRLESKGLPLGRQTFYDAVRGDAIRCDGLNRLRPDAAQYCLVANAQAPGIDHVRNVFDDLVIGHSRYAMDVRLRWDQLSQRANGAWIALASVQPGQ